MKNLKQIHIRFGVVAALVACALAITFAVPAAAQTGDGSIEGVVFLDDNGDGQLAATEEGLGSFTIELERENGSKASAQSDRNGVYRFRNLEAGRYTVRMIDRSGYAKSGIDVYLNLDVREDGEALEGVDFAVVERDEDDADAEDADSEDEDADEEESDSEDMDEEEEESMEVGVDAMAAAIAAGAVGGELPEGVSAEMSDLIASLDDSQASALADALADRDADALADIAAELDDDQRATLTEALADSGDEALAEAVFMSAMADMEADEDGDDGDEDADDADMDDEEEENGDDDVVDADDDADDDDADDGDDDADDDDEEEAPSTMPEAGLADMGGAGMLAVLAALLALFGGFGLMRERALER